jgi:sugar-specific transcriptional regulator TrmB
MLESLTETRKAVDELAGKLYSLHKTNKSNNNRLDYIEILKSSYQIHRKFVELFTKTEREVLIFCKPPFAFRSAKEREEQFQAQTDATERGVITRGIFELPPEDQLEDYFNGQAGKPNSNKGDEARVIAELPIKLNIFDNRTCLFTLEDPIKEKTSLTMLVTEHEAMAKTHRLLFESIWEKAINYYVVNGEKIYLPPYADKNNGGPFKN